MYRFDLHVGEKEATLVLSREGAERGRATWPEKRDMSERLLEATEKLLSDVGIEASEVGDFQVESTMPETFTSRRIAETVARVYTFGAKAQSDEK
ncbi:MAG: hypothetical protein WDN67_00420 [Candidatus Moraniibacteriota bacterium]